MAHTLAQGCAIGTIAIDFATHRRMRLNGGSTKFLSARSILDDKLDVAPRTSISAALPLEAQTIIGGAETFFIGTHYGPSGADASNRGGHAGFVQIVDATTLRWPDYRGNAMFMTLGTIVESPRAGLLFIDWERGTTVQLTGRASIDWDPIATKLFRAPNARFPSRPSSASSRCRHRRYAGQPRFPRASIRLFHRRRRAKEPHDHRRSFIWCARLSATCHPAELV